MIVKSMPTFVGLAAYAVSTIAVASDQAATDGFLKGGSAQLLLRNAYFNRDYKDHVPDAKVWGQGLIFNYKSGFTQGDVGLGLDTYGLAGIKLDSGRGRNFSAFFNPDSSGRPADGQLEGGAAVKLKYSNTTVTYGTQFPVLPVLTYTDNRLLPQAFTGTLISSNEFKDLEFNAGHFTAESTVSQSGKDSGNLKSIYVIGGRYSLTPALSVMLYHSDVQNQYKKWYANAHWVKPITAQQSLTLDFNIYSTDYVDGATSAIAMGGDGNNSRNTIWSQAIIYNAGAHQVQISYQRNTGNTGYATDFGDGSALWLANSLYSDFNLNNERSWLSSYTYNFVGIGLPGLSYTLAYGVGSNIVAGEQHNLSEREIFNQVQYVVQAGSLKDLSLRARSSFYRADDAVGPDMNEIRLFVEYPINIF